MQTVRRRQGEEFEPDCLKETIKHSQEIMVWGEISVHGTGRLEIVDCVMKQFNYIDELENP